MLTKLHSIMKSPALIKILVLSFLFLPLFCLSQNPVDVSQEIMAVNESFMAALQAGDAEAVADHYTEEARVMPPNLPLIDGKENIRDMWNAMLEPGPMDLRVKTVTAEAFGNTAIEEGMYKIHAPDGQVVDDGKYIVIWKKVEGKWRLHQDIFNSNRPAQGTGM